MVYHPGGTLPGYNLVGVFNDEGPPVPIPNTEVKLISAENTCLATDWEDRSMPTQSKETVRLDCLFFCVFEYAAGRFQNHRLTINCGKLLQCTIEER